MTRRPPRSYDKPALPIPPRPRVGFVAPVVMNVDERAVETPEPMPRRARSTSSAAMEADRGGGAESSSQSSSSTTSTSSSSSPSKPAPLAKPAKRLKPEAGYVIEVVYDDPNDLLQEAPKHKSRRNGETTGEILFYGDDVMFGTGCNQCYPELLRDRLLRCGLRLVCNALPGRTLFSPDAQAALALGMPDVACVTGDIFNGAFHFGTVLSSHSPLFVVIALGTNDLKRPLREAGAVSPELVVAHVTRLVAHCRTLVTGHCQEGRLRIVLVVPPPIRLTEHARALGFDEASLALVDALRPALFALRGRLDVVVVDVGAEAARWTNGVCPSTAATARELADAVWAAIEAELPRPMSTRKSRKDPA